MLHADNPEIRAHLLDGFFGLEKESLRVTGDGFFSHTRHPFVGNTHIVRDFCENQTEINTGVYDSIAGALAELRACDDLMRRSLAALPEPEYLWPFSNPPYIRTEEDVPIAIFEGAEAEKTAYREYLALRHSRYKMTLCGIHFNFSFSEELLRREFALSGESDFQAWQDRLYLDLAARAAAYGWIVTAVTAASPLMDSSYVERGVFDQDLFMGLASVRCSELGYWNAFAPILDYTSVAGYVDSIQSYVDRGLIWAASELYYPIRLKPPGTYTLQNLKEKGVNHIELRMIDLNPLAPDGVDARDLTFAHLLLVWLASLPPEDFTPERQVQSVQNFKNAAHYDLLTVNISAPNNILCPVAEAGHRVIDSMRTFYAGFPEDVQQVLDFEEDKFTRREAGYAWQVRRQYSGGFVKKGLELTKARTAQTLSGR